MNIFTKMSREDDAWQNLHPMALCMPGFNKIAIADPAVAPYGAAAVETMKKLGLSENSVGQNRAGHRHRSSLPIRGHR